MRGRFLPSDQVMREELSWGKLAWTCRPADTGAKHLVAIEVSLAPGGGHAFHQHADQEEMIYCLEGEVEQWLDQAKRTLRPGDAVFIADNVVHASFNRSDRPARLLAVLGPAKESASGYEVTEVADQEPWSQLMP